MLPSRRSQNIAVVQAGCSRNWITSEIGLWFIGRTSQSKFRRLSFRCSPRALQSPPCLDDASDGPGLGGRTARQVGRLCFEDFADGAEPGVAQVITHGAETLQRQSRIAVHAVFRQRVMA